jgi:hypothetical protein
LNESVGAFGLGHIQVVHVGLRRTRPACFRRYGFQPLNPPRPQQQLCSFGTKRSRRRSAKAARRARDQYPFAFQLCSHALTNSQEGFACGEKSLREKQRLTQRRQDLSV